MGAALTAIVGLLFLMSDSDLMERVFPAGRRLAGLSYDLPFLWRQNVPTSNVVILYMDRPSHQRLGQDQFLNWDRSTHARLIGQLHRCGAKAIVFDVLFGHKAISAYKGRNSIDFAQVSAPGNKTFLLNRI